MQLKKNIHLLYVPTIYCNLGCRYCYLGTLTDQGKLKQDNERAGHTLQFAIDKLLEAGVQPFHLSLHGGEVSTLQPETLAGLFGQITHYYAQHRAELDALGFRKQHPHIKTNLFNFHQIYDLCVENHVSVSASIDLPLSMHDRYRRTKSDHSTLPQTLENLQLLARYPHRHKFSSTLYQGHFWRIDELIADIWHLHRQVGYDMNQYNFMFGFEAALCDEKFDTQLPDELQPMTEAQQVAFYQRMRQEFAGTELDEGFQKHWFEEFTPSYCTHAPNCGEKFFLLQSDGEVYSCVRGQGVKEFRYGNIFTDSVDDILLAGRNNIKSIIHQHGLHDDCRQCEYLYLCNTGCPFVKHQRGLAPENGKSYTCLLQKEIYKDHPQLYPPIRISEEKRAALYDYLHKNHPQRLFEIFAHGQPSGLMLPNDLGQERNALVQIILRDTVLQELYSSASFSLRIDNKTYLLESQLLKYKRQMLLMGPQSSVYLKIRREVFLANCPDPQRNTLYLQMLRDTPVVYGDDQRTKQEHTFTLQLYYNTLLDEPENTDTHLMVNLMPLILPFAHTFREQVLNNLFVSTSALRDYHYQKQKENGFYHIQAINLPFQNVEFFWFDDPSDD